MCVGGVRAGSAAPTRIGCSNGDKNNTKIENMLVCLSCGKPVYGPRRQGFKGNSNEEQVREFPLDAVQRQSHLLKALKSAERRKNKYLKIDLILFTTVS